MPSLAECALLLVAHGSAKTESAMAATESHATRLRMDGRFAAVATGYLTGGPPVEEALAGLRNEWVILVPHFMSDGYFTRLKIPERLALTGRHTRRDGRVIAYARPPAMLDGFPALVANALGVLCLENGLAPSEIPALLVAHGTERDAAQERWARGVAARIDGFAGVEVAFVEQAPLLSDILPRLARPAAVAGLFAANGFHAEADVRAALPRARTMGPIFYTGAVGADPAMAELILVSAQNAIDDIDLP